jgi:uncharacterized membrane protein YqjE
MGREKHKIMKVILKIGVTLLFAALMVMLLWNWVVVDIFGLPTINYLQAIGLWILPKLLIYKLDNNSEDDD